MKTMVEISRIQEREPGAVQIYLVEMEVVRVFVIFPAVGGEIEDTFFVVDTDNIFAMEGTAGDLVL